MSLHKSTFNHKYNKYKDFKNNFLEPTLELNTNYMHLMTVTTGNYENFHLTSRSCPFAGISMGHMLVYSKSK